MNGVEINLQISAKFKIAPINSHHVLQGITNVLKEMSELERIDSNNGEIISTKIELNYVPVGLKKEKS